jgi:hypothetical protein
LNIAALPHSRHIHMLALIYSVPALALLHGAGPASRCTPRAAPITLQQPADLPADLPPALAARRARAAGGARMSVVSEGAADGSAADASLPLPRAAPTTPLVPPCPKATEHRPSRHAPVVGAAVARAPPNVAPAVEALKAHVAAAAKAAQEALAPPAAPAAATPMGPVLKVVGIGGGGCSTVSRIPYALGGHLGESVSLSMLNTDAQALHYASQTAAAAHAEYAAAAASVSTAAATAAATSSAFVQPPGASGASGGGESAGASGAQAVSTRQLGTEFLYGNGAGGRPSWGRDAALASAGTLQLIERHLRLPPEMPLLWTDSNAPPPPAACDRSGMMEDTPPPPTACDDNSALTCAIVAAPSLAISLCRRDPVRVCGLRRRLSYRGHGRRHGLGRSTGRGGARTAGRLPCCGGRVGAVWVRG